MPADQIIRRGFADVGDRQVHYRTCGSGTPILLIHASPGSSKQLSSLIAALGAHGRVIAPDTPGNGDSPALPVETPSIADLAAASLAFLDAMGLERVDVYGSHTGAAIATELAILAPARIGRIVLDGVQLLTPEQRAEVLDRYAFPFAPDLEGAYLVRVFQFCRDQYLFYPWYDRTREGQRIGGLPAPAVLRDWVVEVLKAGETYHLNYRAAFRWDARARLPLIGRPTLLIAAENDPLFDDSERLAPALPDGQFLALPRYDAPDFAALRLDAVTAFFASGLDGETGSR